MMGVLEHLAGAVLGIVTVLVLGIAGAIMFIPDVGRYLKMKRL